MAAPQVIRVKGDHIADDGALVRQWGVQGHGIILKSELDVNDDLSRGNLVEVLPEFSPPPIPLQMLFPPPAHNPGGSPRWRIFSSKKSK